MSKSIGLWKHLGGCYLQRQILFTDEAYSLARGGEKDFGKEAIDTLVKNTVLSFCVTFEVDIPRSERSYKYAWEEHEGSFEEIKKLHFEDLMTVGQISEKLNIPDWIILYLFKAKKVDKLNYSELCRRRRELDFDKLYDLGCPILDLLIN